MVDVVILAGGKATRFKSFFGDEPKITTKIAGIPFIYHLFNNLSSQGFNKVICSLGTDSTIIANTITQYDTTFLTPACIVENEPLGTGGAIKNCLPLISDDYFIVINGDTFIDLDLNIVLKKHLESKKPITIVASTFIPPEAGGLVVANEHIQNFTSKSPTHTNSGIYIFNKTFFEKTTHQSGVFSIENDYFTNLEKTEITLFITEQKYYDIGTEEKYKEALEYFANRQ